METLCLDIVKTLVSKTFKTRDKNINIVIIKRKYFI